MKALLRFAKTTLVGGLFFLLPVVLTLVLLRHAIQWTVKVVHPLAERLPIDSVIGLKTPDILAALLLIAVGFLAGLVARTTLGAHVSRRLEQVVLRKMPGYTLLKGATGGAVASGAPEVEVALVRFDDNTVLGFIVEKQTDGLLTVFVPSAPTPAAGSVFYLPEDRVTRLDVPVADAAKVIMRLGVGSKELLERKPAPEGGTRNG
jgi:uncharacterized membrane protein